MSLLYLSHCRFKFMLGEKAKAQLIRDSRKDIELSITDVQKNPLNYTQHLFKLHLVREVHQVLLSDMVLPRTAGMMAEKVYKEVKNPGITIVTIHLAPMRRLTQET
ncbi:hypothetical protein IFM89_002471 [Coptis chinensis]|uniref:Uncharacterized protein n=1 Tax=Coptis chinensis TaxID=261450 RepID=A0A835HN93_9MAGN|nr:hypothetical protein IFM89_002471 [Coptis chinensis]